MRSSLLIFFVLLCLACSKDKETPPVCDDDISSYNTNIKMIFDRACTEVGCHSSDAPIAGIDLSSYSAAVEYIRANASDFTISINQTGSNPMPPAPRSKLTDQEIQDLLCWIEKGYAQ